MIHNHTLISPEAIRQPWPPAVFDKIAYYARQRSLSTADTRDRIKEDFPGLVWDERRFYNRLTEERKQIRHRDSENRVFNTMDLAAKVASLASSDANLSCRVIKTMENMFNELCDQLRVDPTSAASRVFTSSSPPTSAGGGGSVGASGASMTMTSPMSTSPGLYPSSGTSGTPQTSDHLVTYPGCIISVKSTSNQKGRPSSMSSPTADSNYGLGLGASSSLNDRKRSLSDECFTRTGLPSATASSFGSAMNAPSMMGHLDISAAAASGLGGSLSGLDPVMPGNSGLLMMQGGNCEQFSDA
ncbi:hypothetical protein BGX31_000685 [Mortierella sp. GBA43]|nr:hypothetical protein BGX31_000685 [Mortierella sp. GBA43]